MANPGRRGLLLVDAKPNAKGQGTPVAGRSGWSSIENSKTFLRQGGLAPAMLIAPPAGLAILSGQDFPRPGAGRHAVEQIRALGADRVVNQLVPVEHCGRRPSGGEVGDEGTDEAVKRRINQLFIC